MAESLLTIDLFRETIYKLHDILTPYGLDLVNIITSVSKKTFISMRLFNSWEVRVLSRSKENEIDACYV